MNQPPSTHYGASLPQPARSAEPTVAPPSAVSAAAVAGAAGPRPLMSLRALAGLALSTLLAALGTSVANVALPTLVGEFGASFAAVQWVVLAYLLAITAAIVGVGRLGDLLGRRRILLVGIALFAAGAVLAGCAPSLAVLIAARAVQGLGAAAMMALTLALAGEAVPPAKTGRLIGALGTMSALGTAIGPSLGGWLIAGAGWRTLFWMNLPLGLAAFLAVLRGVPTDRRSSMPGWVRLDWAGTVLLVVALGAFALTTTAGRVLADGGGLVPGAVALAAAAGFVLVELRVAAPLVDLRMFRDAQLREGLGLSAVVATVVMTTMVVGPFYLARVLGLRAGGVGLALSAGPVAAALVGAPAGRWVDQHGARRVSGVGLAGMVVGAIGLALLPSASGAAGYVVPIVVLTGGYALFQSANNTAVMNAARAERRGVVAGLLNLSRNLGLVTGASALSALFAWSMGAADVATASGDAVARGTRVTYAAAVGLLVAASAVSRSSAVRAGGAGSGGGNKKPAPA